MDIASVIRHRLDELGIEQRDLAVAAGVTESYISQLLAKKKMPPAPDRTEIYDRIAKALKLPGKELSRLADMQRREEAKRRVLDPARPLFPEFRQLILRKCAAAKRRHVASIFEREPFGELERFIAQALLDVAKGVAREGLENPDWIRRVAQLSKRSYEKMRVLILEILDTDVFHVSVDNCILFLDPLIQSWNLEISSFAMDVALNRRLARNPARRLEVREVEPERSSETEPALAEFLRDRKLSKEISEEEAEFLKRLRFEGRRPSVLYYYRELQNLRDPLNFAAVSIGKAGAGAGSEQDLKRRTVATSRRKRRR